MADATPRAPQNDRADALMQKVGHSRADDGKSAATRVSSADQVVGEVYRGLYEGRYSPGQKLIEADLTKRFRVGRGTVREALRRLVAEGLATAALHQGVHIRRLTRQDAVDMVQVITSLTGLAARLAAERAKSAAEETELKKTLRDLSRTASSGNRFDFARTRDRFHRQLAYLSRNGELQRLVFTIQAHLIRIQVGAADSTAADRRALQHYRKIVEAVLAGKSALAERAMHTHMKDVHNLLLEAPDVNFAR